MCEFLSSHNCISDIFIRALSKEIKMSNVVGNIAYLAHGQRGNYPIILIWLNLMRLTLWNNWKKNNDQTVTPVTVTTLH